MIKLRFSLLMALLMVVMSVWADNAPAKAQAALKKMSGSMRRDNGR